MHNDLCCVLHTPPHTWYNMCIYTCTVSIHPHICLHIHTHHPNQPTTPLFSTHTLTNSYQPSCMYSLRRLPCSNRVRILHLPITPPPTHPSTLPRFFSFLIFIFLLELFILPPPRMHVSPSALETYATAPLLTHAYPHSFFPFSVSHYPP